MKESIPLHKTYSENSYFFADFYELYTKLLLGNNGKLVKIITITSAVASEGKTTIASYLALTAALISSEHFLLVDGDLRRPRIHDRFHIMQSSGFAEAMQHSETFHDFIYKTDLPNLHVFGAGRAVSNPLKLLNLDNTRNLLSKLSRHYRMIFIDSPPVIPVRDSLRLGQLSDGVALVVRAGKTPRSVVRRAVTTLKEARCNLLGIIMNDMSRVLPYYYQHKYYHYEYDKVARD